MKRTVLNLFVNLSLLLLGSLMIFSGLLIQIKYHMGNNGTIDINNSVLGVNYFGWSDIHRISIAFFSASMVFHIIQHWKWYKTVVKKRLLAKNKQVIILSIVFVIVAITGYIPWFVSLTGGDEIMRKAFIEIHDKLALILFIYLILHVIKRLKWFNNTLKKLNALPVIYLKNSRSK